MPPGFSLPAADAERNAPFGPAARRRTESPPGPAQRPVRRGTTGWCSLAQVTSAQGRASRRAAPRAAAQQSAGRAAVPATRSGETIIRYGRTRRQALGVALIGATGLTVTGCGLFGDDTPPPPDPLQPLLDETLALAAAYDRAVLAQPGLAKRLTPLGADHRAHAEALTRLIGAPSGSAAAPSASASAAPAGGDAAATVAALRKAEQAAVKTATAACTAAAADRAMLIGSITACRASHAEALR